MSKNPISWDTSRTTVFADEMARDSKITDEDWKYAMDQLTLEKIVLQEANEWHDRVGRNLVTYEFTHTPSQLGVLMIESGCYGAWKDAKNEIHTDHDTLLGQALIECVLTDPKTSEYVRDREKNTPDATIEVFLSNRDSENGEHQHGEYQHGDDLEYLEAVLVRLNTASESAPDPQRLLRAVAQWAESRAEDIGNQPEGPAGETLPPMFTMGARPSQDQSAGTNKA